MRTIGFALGCLAALALGPGLAEVIVHSGWSPFEVPPAATTATANSPAFVDAAAWGEQL